MNKECTAEKFEPAVALRNEYLEDGYVDIEIESYEEDTK